MTVAIASRVALTGALSGREYVSVTIPFGSLLVVNSRSRAQLQAWLVPNRKELIVGDQRRGVHGYVSRSSPSRGIAANAIEDKVSRSRLPHSNKKDDGEALKVGITREYRNQFKILSCLSLGLGFEGRCTSYINFVLGYKTLMQILFSRSKTLREHYGFSLPSCRKT